MASADFAEIPAEPTNATFSGAAFVRCERSTVRSQHGAAGTTPQRVRRARLLLSPMDDDRNTRVSDQTPLSQALASLDVQRNLGTPRESIQEIVDGIGFRARCLLLINYVECTATGHGDTPPHRPHSEIVPAPKTYQGVPPTAPAQLSTRCSLTLSSLAERPRHTSSVLASVPRRLNSRAR